MTTDESSPKKPTEASVLARLEELKGDRRRPQTALLAEHLESIEGSLARGIPRAAIWEALCEEGFTMTFKSFETFLHRLRKRRAATPSQAPKPTAPAKPTQTNPSAAVASQQTPTSDPTPKSGLNIPGYKSKLTDKDREEYKALKEAIKDLPDRERRKRMEQFWSQR